MDNLCHTLVGAAIGRAAFSRRTPADMATLLVASNLPDIDVAVFATGALPMAVRRGWTHGVLAQALLPVLLAAGVAWWRRRRGARFGALVALAYAGVVSHVLLDWLNTYGVRLLMPFSGRWFYGDALYIVDPWVWLALSAGVWVSARRGRQGRHDAARPARLALLAVAVYMAAMVGANLAARAVVKDGLARAGLSPATRFMVTPVVLNPLRREVVVDLGTRYEKGHVWFDPLPRFRPAGFGIETGLADPARAALLRTPLALEFLSWSRFPFVAADGSTTPPTVWLNDYRYAATGSWGWSATRLTPDPGAAGRN